MTKQSSVCVLVSGGLDSCVLLGELLTIGRSVWPVYFRFGLSWEPLELSHLRKFLSAVGTSCARELHILEFRDSALYGGHWSVTGKHIPGDDTDDEAVYLPGRNILLLANTSVFCALREINQIYLGTLNGNPFPDATREFFTSYGNALSLGLGLSTRLSILTPFAELTKADVVKRGQRFPLQFTWSCLSTTAGIHCGKCNKCAERRRSFETADIPDPTEYAY